MKSRIICLSLVALVASSPSLAEKSARIQPSSHAGTITIVVSGKNRLYHKTTKAKPIIFEVDGPTPVRLLSRILPDTIPNDGRMEYRLCVEINQVRLFDVEETAGISSKVTLPDSGFIGTLERETLYIPKGRHKVWLFPDEDSITVAVRLYRGEKNHRTDPKWKVAVPLRHAGVVHRHLEPGQDDSLYYRFDATHPIRTDLAGPAQVQIQTRIDFLPGGPTTQVYRIEVYLDGELTDSPRYEAEPELRSRTAYRERREVIPGKRKSTGAIHLPGGTHTLRIVLRETSVPGGAARILVRKAMNG